jgi:hypothetical protein
MRTNAGEMIHLRLVSILKQEINEFAHDRTSEDSFRFAQLDSWLLCRKSDENVHGICTGG